MKIENVIIVGSGPAGLTAALYTARADLRPLVIAGSLPGGQLTETAYVENWPGQPHILGPELMLKLQQHAQHFGTTIASGIVDTIDCTQKPFTLLTNKKQTLQAHAVIVATGAVPNRLGCPGESEYWGKGVSTCAVCDGALFKNEPVVVVGGGDTALEHALFLTQFTDKITIVHRTDEFTASTAMQARLRAAPTIQSIAQHDVTNIDGNGKQVAGITITDLKTKQLTHLPARALFLAIGSRPNTAMLCNQISCTASGHIITDTCSSRTSIPGIFACGDVVDAHYRQAITAAGAGCMAALDAIAYVESL